jgi:hypothetical protein
VEASDNHCRVATARWDPCEIARAGGALCQGKIPLIAYPSTGADYEAK